MTNIQTSLPASRPGSATDPRSAFSAAPSPGARPGVPAFLLGSPSLPAALDQNVCPPSAAAFPRVSHGLEAPTCRGSLVRLFGWACEEDTHKYPSVWIARVAGFVSPSLPRLSPLATRPRFGSGWGELYALPGSVVAWGAVDREGHAAKRIYYAVVSPHGSVTALWDDGGHNPTGRSSALTSARWWTWAGEDVHNAYMSSHYKPLAMWLSMGHPGWTHCAIVPESIAPPAFNAGDMRDFPVPALARDKMWATPHPEPRQQLMDKYSIVAGRRCRASRFAKAQELLPI